jgi:lauroyl/myristoyl acyltransferase
VKFINIKDFYPLFVITLMKMVNWFPSPKPGELVVKSIAFAAYQFSRNKRRRIEKNLPEVFDEELSENRKREIVKRYFFHFWQENLSLLPSSKGRAARQGVDIRGVEHLQRALEKGKGVILWESSSFGKRVLSKRILHENGFSIQQVFAETHFEGFLRGGRSATWVQRHIIKRVLEKSEKRFVSEIIYLPSSDSLVFTRILLDRLKQNAILCVPGDGNEGQKRIPMKCLNHIQLFATGMVSLARISGASILPMFCTGEENGRISLIIEPPIYINKRADRERGLENSVSQYVSLLESYIRKYPEEYKWWHFLSRLNKY